jgi:hypothetical protein
MWSALPQTQNCVMTVCYSTWDDTLIDAIVAVTTCGVSLRPGTARGSSEYGNNKESILTPLDPPLDNIFKQMVIQ